MILSFINIYWTTWGSMLLCGDSRYTPQWRFWKGFQSITAAFYGACDIHRTWQSLPKAFTEITPEAAAQAAFWWIGQSNMKSKAAGSLAALAISCCYYLCIAINESPESPIPKNCPTLCKAQKYLIISMITNSRV